MGCFNLLTWSWFTRSVCLSSEMYIFFKVLYKYGLAQTAYLDLVHQKKPLELIYKLYEGAESRSN
jgi:hypothetical protein